MAPEEVGRLHKLVASLLQEIDYKNRRLYELESKFSQVMEEKNKLHQILMDG